MYCAGVYEGDSYSVKEIITEIILLSFKEEIYFKNLLIKFSGLLFNQNSWISLFHWSEQKTS